jgi:arsenate reductase
MFVFFFKLWNKVFFMFRVVIHHNPDCDTSLNVLAMIRASGYEPVVLEYTKLGWTRGQLLALFAAANLSCRQALREQKSPAKELGLLEEGVTEEAILEQVFIFLSSCFHVLCFACVLFTFLFHMFLSACVFLFFIMFVFACLFLIFLFVEMLLHPILVNRPIVCTPKGVKLCRPSQVMFLGGNKS